MKQPTTSYQIAVQDEIKINRQFLLDEGWTLEEEKPLYEKFVHSKNADIVCSIGLYGEFSIAQLHWCNKTPDKIFSAINPSITESDYKKILELLRIEIG